MRPRTTSPEASGRKKIRPGPDSRKGQRTEESWGDRETYWGPARFLCNMDREKGGEMEWIKMFGEEERRVWGGGGGSSLGGGCTGQRMRDEETRKGGEERQHEKSRQL